MVKTVTYLKRHLLFSSLLMVCVVFFLALPTVSKWALQHYLLAQSQAQGVTKVNIGSLNINPFTGSVSLNQLKLLKPDNTDATADFAHIGHLHLTFKLSELLQGRLWIESFEVNDAQIPITQTTDFKIFIAGLALSTNSERDSTRTMPPIGVQNLRLNQVRFVLNSASGQGLYHINQLHLNDLYTWETRYARLILNSAFNHSPLNANLQLHLFAKHPKLVGTLKLSQLNLTELQGLLQTFAPEHPLTLTGKLSTDLTLTLETTDSGLHYYQTGEMTLDNSQITHAKANKTQQTGLVKQLHWQGDVHFFNEATPKLFVKGALQGKQLKLAPAHQPSAQQFSLSTLTAQLNLHGVFDEHISHISFKQNGNVSLTGVRIQQPDQNITLKEALWNGQIAYQATKPSAEQTVSAKGQLKLNNVDVAQPTQHLNLASTAWNGQATLTQMASTAKALKVNTQGALSVSQLNLDYNDSTDTNVKPNHIALNQADWNGQFEVQLDAQTQINALGQLTLKALKTQQNLSQKNLRQPNSTDLAANLLAELNMQAQFDDAGFKLTQQGAVTLSDATLNHAPFTVQLANTQWQGKVAVAQNKPLALDPPTSLPLPLPLPLTSPLSVQANGSAHLQQLTVQHRLNNTPTSPTQIAQLRQLDIANIAIESLDKMRFTHLKADDFVLGDRTAISPGLVKLNAIQLDSVEWQQNQVSQQPNSQHNSQPKHLILGHLLLRDSQTNLTLNAQYQPSEINELLERLTSEDPAHPNASVATTLNTLNAAEPPSLPSLHYQLASLNATGQHTINVTAHATQPPLLKTVVLTKFTLGAIDSAQPNQDTAYTLNAKIDEFSQFISQGQVQPLNATLGLSSQSQLDSLSLTGYSGLVEQAIGYQIKSGQLSGKFNTTIQNGQLSAQNDINLNKFELRRSNSKIAQAFEKDFAMPLESGIALLQDKSGNIKLSLPVSGDANNPNFDMGGVISKAMNSALMTASRTYLLLALQPFGAIALAGEFVADQLSAVKLQPITFKPGQDTLSNDMQLYLTKINTLLNERKDIQIKLCGGASEADRPALQKAIKPGFNESDVQQTDINDTQLHTLAMQRQSLIKRQLMQMGTPSKQVIICQPTINRNADTPQVEVGI